MFSFFKKNNNEDINNPLTKIAALLIHAAKIDQNYTKNEKKLVKQAIVELGANNENIDQVLLKAEEIEKDVYES